MAPPRRLVPLRQSGGTIILIVAVFVFAVVTFLVVNAAGGDYAPDNSNTPNGVKQGPPAFSTS